ncbi:unnamed protein product, partial [Ectocarpus sp. 12 AP-2014]
AGGAYLHTENIRAPFPHLNLFWFVLSLFASLHYREGFRDDRLVHTRKHQLLREHITADRTPPTAAAAAAAVLQYCSLLNTTAVVTTERLTREGREPRRRRGLATVKWPRALALTWRAPLPPREDSPRETKIASIDCLRGGGCDDFGAAKGGDRNAIQHARL